MEEEEIGMAPSQDHRSRAAKPATIHACAQSGDLPGVQRKLAENPSLLNERNPVVRNIPVPPSPPSVPRSALMALCKISLCVLAPFLFFFHLLLGSPSESIGG